MSVLENNKHFLHEHISFIESTSIEGKCGGYNRFLTNLGVKCEGRYWEKDHSVIDWHEKENHYQFFFDYENNEEEIKEYLRGSDLSKSEFLYTWLDYNDPIIKIKTIDFIENWEEFYISSIEGLVLVSIDGSKFLEFTDDWKYNLNSNFEIKPNTKVSS